MTQADIDRLAEFCRLADKGYRRDPDGYWVQDRPGLDRFAWRPDVSDDDCRVVLERFFRVADHYQMVAFSEQLFKGSVFWSGCVRDVVLATPAEKCAAVAKVMGDA